MSHDRPSNSKCRVLAALAALSLLTSGVPVSAAVSFDPPLVSPLAGPGAGDSLVAADLDLDCDVDIAVSRDPTVASETLSLIVRLGNSSGSFPGGSTVGAGIGISDVEIADLNDDGIPDLVTTENFESGQVPSGICASQFPRVTVHLGDGIGGFTFLTCLVAKDHPNAVAVGDFDEDRTPDLVVVNARTSSGGATSPEMLFFKGVGDGSFQNGVLVGDRRGDDVEVADFDGDGHLDLAIAGGAASYVLLGSGDGSFAPSTTPIGGTAFKVAVGDLNNDGAPDLFSVGSNRASSSDDFAWIALNLNNGSGGFATANLVLTGAHPVDVQSADLDLDGLDDLVVANNLGNTVSVFLALAGGLVGPQQTFIAGATPTALALVDANRDGYLDIVVSNRNEIAGEPSDGTLSVLLQQSGSALSVPDQSLADGLVAIPYLDCLQARGGTPPISWSVAVGELAAGLNVDGTTGAVAGVPTLAQSVQFTVDATDSTSVASGMVSLRICEDADSDGFSTCENDCDDQDADRFPGNAEICDAKDNDCDGTVDSGLDGDSDGIDDLCDNCPSISNSGQADADNDGAGDVCDGCPADPGKLAPGICGCGTSDIDTDLDGTADCIDACPVDPNKIAAGICGCGVPDVDGDADGIADCIDACPSDPLNDVDLDEVCGDVDNCPTVPNSVQTDADSDGAGDACDGCPIDPNKLDPGTCGCGIPETDTDADETPDCIDSCPFDPTKIVPGDCGCGIPDTDGDNDGTANCIDGCPTDPLKIAPGSCGCGIPDTDSDSDGTPNCVDLCPADPGKIAPGDCGCGVADTDSDSDGTADCIDQCPADPGKIVPGDCGCGVADIDSDSDGTADCVDLCPADPGKIAPGDCGCGVADIDSDSDGTADCVDLCPTDPNKIDPGTCGCGIAESPGCGGGCAVNLATEMLDNGNFETWSAGLPDGWAPLTSGGPILQEQADPLVAGPPGSSLHMVRTGPGVIRIAQGNKQLVAGKWYRIQWRALAPAPIATSLEWRFWNNSTGQAVEADGQTWSAAPNGHEWIGSSNWTTYDRWVRIDPDFAPSAEFAFLLRWLGGTAGQDLYLDRLSIRGPFADGCVLCPDDPDHDLDHDRICGDVDNCAATYNPLQVDDDLDGIGNVCDVCAHLADPTQADADGDGAGDACDCQPGDPNVRSPGEVSMVTSAKSGDAAEFIWPIIVGGDVYSVTRGELSTLSVAGPAGCRVQSVASTSYTDTDLPSPDSGFYYLVQGRSLECGLGEFGFDSSEQQRSPSCGIDFNSVTLSSYSNQDHFSTVTIEDSGATLHLIGDTWKRIDFPWTVIPGVTTIEFDFKSTVEAEVHGLGLDDDDSLGNAAQIFRVYGTQTFGNGSFDDYPTGADAQGWKHYSIVLAPGYPISNAIYLVFVNDNDAGPPAGESYFRNVVVRD